jgi:peptidoglycan/LPS O-acetylase OafA/YrhL
MSNKTIYFPGLNGLRAISVLAVVISHTTTGLYHFNIDPGIFGTLPDGNPKGLWLADYGVTIFFVLSGFLITFLLQSEKEQQPISVKKFYLRRILRIWPLYYAYVLIVVAICLIYGFYLNQQSLMYVLFFGANIPFLLNTSIPLLIHYWSLGVEEQFYIFWPWVNKKIKSLFWFTVIAIVCIMTIKLVLHFRQPNSFWERAIQITRLHCMMIGGLGAILYKQRHPLFLRFADNKFTQLICWLFILLVALNKYHFVSVIDTEIIAVVALLLIIGQIQVKNRLINLENRIMDFLGKISYGIYVLHPVILFFFSWYIGRYTVPVPFNYILAYTLIPGCTILLAWLSYTYFEKGFLKYKKNYEVVKSASSRQGS